jgi:FtsP/CotA-like multicopper oxidase with cupredoxin domain
MTKAMALRIGMTLGLLTTLLVLPTTAAQAATVPFELCAKSGTTTMPDGVSIPVLGYVTGACPGASLTRPGGPVLQATAGDTIQLTLHNGLSKDTSMLFAGQPMIPDLAGVAPGGTKVYSIPVPNPGTYLYEAGLLPNTQHQTAMGLYGALVVHPASGPGRVYDEPATAYDSPGPADPVQGAVVLSEIDPVLNNRANPAMFDMRNYRPKYWLINGYAFDATQPNLHNIPALSGGRSLLRFINAGMMPHSMGVLGLEQTLISDDGGLLHFSQTTAAHTVAPGQRVDALVSIPPVAENTLYPLYDGSMLLHNSGFPLSGNTDDLGGMMTFLEIGGTAPGAGGPDTSNADVAPSPTNGTLDVSVTATTDPTATAAEFFIDATGADGSGAGMTGAPGAVTGTISAADVLALTSGPHTIFVHAFDGTNWGPFDFATLIVDTTGPVITQLALNPNPSNSSAAVALTGTASDTGTGNGDIVAAEYFLGTPSGSGVPMALGTGPAPVTSVSATIPAGTPSNTIYVRAQDELGNWGPFQTIALSRDGTGPSTTIISVTPSANNGNFPLDATNRVVRIQTFISDSTSGNSNIVTAEGFIKPAATLPGTLTPGSGFPLRPTDGLFSGPSEFAFGDIPLTTIRLLPDGDYNIWVRGKDAAGNWGPLVSVPYRIDRTAPSVSGLTVSAPGATSPSTNGTTTDNTSFNLLGTATDAGAFPTNITRAEWFDGTDPGAGLGNAMSPSDGSFNSSSEGLTASIDFVSRGWAPGSHTVFVRTMDQAGTWSPNVAFVVNVVYPNSIFSNWHDTTTSPYGWSSRTGTAARFSVPTAAQMPAGAGQGLQIAMCPAAAACTPGVAFVTDQTPFQDATYRARFYFTPNGAGLGNRLVTIFSGYTGNSGGTQVFLVQTRFNSGNYQVRLGIARSNGSSPVFMANWVNVVNGQNWIELSWRSSNDGAAKATMTVNGVSASTTGIPNTANTNAYRIESVRLGPSAYANSGSVQGSLRFDSFVSTRRTVIGP